MPPNVEMESVFMPPNILMESVFLTAVVEVHKGWDVACFNIPGAFLHANSNEDITMILKGHLAEVVPNLYQ
jgi:hypothetical protein